MNGKAFVPKDPGGSYRKYGRKVVKNDFVEMILNMDNYSLKYRFCLMFDDFFNYDFFDPKLNKTDCFLH